MRRVEWAFGEVHAEVTHSFKRIVPDLFLRKIELKSIQRLVCCLCTCFGQKTARAFFMKQQQASEAIDREPVDCPKFF